MIVLASSTLGYGVGLAVAGPHGSTAGQWLLDFSKTSGATAIAAIIAASIAFIGISRQVGAARALLAHQQADTASQRWWQSFEWAATRGFPVRTEEKALPYDTTLNTLFALRDSATSDVQRQACFGLINELSLQLASQEQSREPTSAEANAWRALSQWITSDLRSEESTRPVTARVNEHQTFEAIRSILRDGADGLESFDTNVAVNGATDSNVRLDAVAIVDGVAVVIEITHGKDPSRKVRALRQALRGSAFEHAPILAITSGESPVTHPTARTPVAFVQWLPGDKPDVIASSLRRLARSTQA